VREPFVVDNLVVEEVRNHQFGRTVR